MNKLCVFCESDSKYLIRVYFIKPVKHRGNGYKVRICETCKSKMRIGGRCSNVQI